MCGICGVCGPGGVDKATLRDMTNTIEHRGPDGEGYFVDGDVGLGHRRLSIIDLETGDQPIHNEDESIWIVFNGEIYNHLALREDLEKKGHRYYTVSDTESIVHAYEEYGTDCVKKLNGMFAFAIWDSQKKSLFLARDRIGIKPLYYSEVDGRLIFGSEIKAILKYPGFDKTIDKKALSNYLTYNYVPSPATIFENTKKLKPGHILVRENGSVQVSSYWDVKSISDTNLSRPIMLDQIVDKLQQSVKDRLISDVPLGAFLSGGIDSSIIVALMSKVSKEPVKTFSIGFEESSFNELKYASIIAEKFNTDHHEFVVEADAVELLPKLIYHFDEPFADSSAMPTFLVSEMARKHVKVCLSGDGGDETFCGYDRYAACKVARYYRFVPGFVRGPLAWSINKFPISYANKSFAKMSKRFVNAADMEPERGYYDWVTIFHDEEKANLCKEHPPDSFEQLKQYYDRFESNDFVGKTMYVDIKTYLVDDILVKTDRTSMANSLEVRVPFLDHDVVEFSSRIPSQMKMNGIGLKHLLKKSFRNLLPKEIINRKKQGFGVPLGFWFRGKLAYLIDDFLLSKDTITARYFNQDYIEKIVKQHNQNVMDHAHKLWALLFFELWHRHHIDGEKIRL